MGVIRSVNEGSLGGSCSPIVSRPDLLRGAGDDGPEPQLALICEPLLRQIRGNRLGKQERINLVRETEKALCTLTGLNGSIHRLNYTVPAAVRFYLDPNL